MKKIIATLSLLLSLILVVSCQNSKTEAKGEVPKVVKLAFNQEAVGNLNPFEYSPSQFITQDMVYEGLVYYGENGEIKPSLAESWTVSEDGKTYTFNLRKNVKFSDGSDFTSKNVVRNFDTIFSKENKANHTWFEFTNRLKSYKALDDYTFQIELDTPYTATLYDLAMIRPIRFLGDAGFPDEGKNPAKEIKASIGTGPWVLKEHKDNEYAIFVQNEYYWGEKPAAKEIMIKVIPDSETLALEFEAGNIDLIYGNGLISLDRFNTYKSDPKYTAASSEPMSSRMLLLNTTSKFLNDINVRKALSHAIDKESIAQNIFGGVEKPADTIFAPNVPHTNVKLEKYNYDLAVAEKMLDEAGWVKGADGIREKNGQKFEIEFPYIGAKVTDKNVAEYVQGEWKKIGINVKVNAMEEKAYWANAMAKNYDVMLNFTWGAPWDPHAFLTSMTAADSSNGGPDYTAQLGLPMKAQIDKTIRALLVEPDEKKLDEMYNYVLTTLHDQAVYIPLTYQAVLSVYRTGELDGVKFMPEENRLPVNTVVRVK